MTERYCFELAILIGLQTQPWCIPPLSTHTRCQKFTPSELTTNESVLICLPVGSDVSPWVLNTTFLYLSFLFQAKYKEESLIEASESLYYVLPETLATQHAREASDLLSEVHRL